ncbi:MAG TPA: hypothetical protein VG722_05765 [Tepidisphaeraceae bacterium]|nr:hypothetical protein [Tepidisphaeraceae bacterium]
MTMDEIYIATDIETDGPSPGQYSMLSLASVAVRLDKTVASTFERNLETLAGARQDPKVTEFWKSQPEAWAACRENVVSAKEAMKAYVK